jgi:hypothetical protein
MKIMLTCAMPIKNRHASKHIQWSRAASGVKSVNIEPIKIDNSRTILGPNFWAKLAPAI